MTPIYMAVINYAISKACNGDERKLVKKFSTSKALINRTEVIGCVAAFIFTGCVIYLYRHNKKISQRNISLLPKNIFIKIAQRRFREMKVS